MTRGPRQAAEATDYVEKARELESVIFGDYEMRVYYHTKGEVIPAILAALQSAHAAGLAQGDAEIDELRKLVYVPGLWKCKKCGFTLVQRILRACDGAVGVRDEAGEHCPNDGSPLWRVSERDAGNELADRATEYLERALAAEADRDKWKASGEDVVQMLVQRDREAEAARAEGDAAGFEQGVRAAADNANLLHGDALFKWQTAHNPYDAGYDDGARKQATSAKERILALLPSQPKEPI